MLLQPIVLRDRKAAYLNNDCKILLLVLTLHLLVVFLTLWCRFQTLINLLTDVKSILNEDEFFGDTVDTPK